MSQALTGAESEDPRLDAGVGGGLFQTPSTLQLLLQVGPCGLRGQRAHCHQDSWALHPELRLVCLLDVQLPGPDSNSPGPFPETVTTPPGVFCPPV